MIFMECLSHTPTKLHCWYGKKLQTGKEVMKWWNINMADLHKLVKRYFKRNYTYKEIKSVLDINHGINHQSYENCLIFPNHNYQIISPFRFFMYLFISHKNEQLCKQCNVTDLVLIYCIIISCYNALIKLIVNWFIHVYKQGYHEWQQTLCWYCIFFKYVILLSTILFV